MDGSAAVPVRTVALMNQKGGVGKTTTTVNLAAALAQAGRRVCVIDLDPQAHATLHLGVEVGDDDATVYDVLLEPESIEASIQKVRENLWVIPAETDLAAAESELAGEHDRNLRLSRALELVRGRFDMIFMDCPPSLGVLTLNALAAAREVFIPMQAHFLALQGVGKLLETVSLAARTVNPKLHVTGVILCMHDAQTTHSKEVVADLDTFFRDSRDSDVPWRLARVYRPPIRRNIKLAECPSFGQTIFDYDASCAGAKDYASLADRIMRDWDEVLRRRAEKSGVEPAPPKPSQNQPPTADVNASESSTGPETGDGEHRPVVPKPEVTIVASQPEPMTPNGS